MDRTRARRLVVRGRSGTGTRSELGTGTCDRPCPAPGSACPRRRAPVRRAGSRRRPAAVAVARAAAEEWLRAGCPASVLQRIRPAGVGSAILFFRLTSLELGLLIFVALLGATALGIFLGHRARHMAESLKEPFGILQGALLGLVGLLLAFGLSLAVSRYEDRRANVVTAANDIGTTHLRAPTPAEPARSRSLALLVRYTRTALRLSDVVPGSAPARGAVASEAAIQRRLWGLAGQALDRAPLATAPRLYVESLNEMIDGETVRVAALSNRVPTAVLVLEMLGAAVALGLLAAYLAIMGRGLIGVFLAAALVAFLLLVTADLDRPTRGMIRVPDTVLKHQLSSMMQPPTAAAPSSSG